MFMQVIPVVALILVLGLLLALSLAGEGRLKRQLRIKSAKLADEHDQVLRALSRTLVEAKAARYWHGVVQRAFDALGAVPTSFSGDRARDILDKALHEPDADGDQGTEVGGR